MVSHLSKNPSHGEAKEIHVCRLSGGPLERIGGKDVQGQRIRYEYATTTNIMCNDPYKQLEYSAMEVERAHKRVLETII